MHRSAACWSLHRDAIWSAPSRSLDQDVGRAAFQMGSVGPQRHRISSSYARPRKHCCRACRRRRPPRSPIVGLEWVSFIHEHKGVPVTPWNPGLGVAFALLVLGGPAYGLVLFAGVRDRRDLRPAHRAGVAGDRRHGLASSPRASRPPPSSRGAICASTSGSAMCATFSSCWPPALRRPPCRPRCSALLLLAADELTHQRSRASRPCRCSSATSSASPS